MSDYKCSRCGETKDISCFYRDKHSKAGHRRECKRCSRPSKTQKSADSRYRKKHAARVRKRQRAYDRNFPKKRRAKNAIAYEIKVGRMLRNETCEECGSSHQIEAHHDDYDQPLSVRWLCVQCHRNWHKQNGEGANAV